MATLCDIAAIMALVGVEVNPFVVCKYLVRYMRCDV